MKKFLILLMFGSSFGSSAYAGAGLDYLKKIARAVIPCWKPSCDSSRILYLTTLPPHKPQAALPAPSSASKFALPAPDASYTAPFALWEQYWPEVHSEEDLLKLVSAHPERMPMVGAVLGVTSSRSMLILGMPDSINPSVMNVYSISQDSPMLWVDESFVGRLDLVRVNLQPTQHNVILFKPQLSLPAPSAGVDMKVWGENARRVIGMSSTDGGVTHVAYNDGRACPTTEINWLLQNVPVLPRAYHGGGQFSQ